jgi:alkylated DNA repair dioxygenase AlkB
MNAYRAEAGSMLRAPSDLFGPTPPQHLPRGFKYQPGVIDHGEESELIRSIEQMPLKEFEFQGFRGKRRVVSFGWRYDFNGGGLRKTEDIPDVLLPARDKAAAFAGVKPEALQQVLITEYRPGVQIGWHKDRSVFGEVVGISLLSHCTFRLRRKLQSGAWERISIDAAPCSAYLLAGPSRTEWEHSIPPVDALRYSITFRNFKEC